MRYLKTILLFSFFALVLAACSQGDGTDLGSNLVSDSQNSPTPAAPEEPTDPPPTVDQEPEETPTPRPPEEEASQSPDEEDDELDEPTDPADEIEPESGEAAEADDTANSTPDGILTEDDRSERQRLIGDNWNTDWNRHTVPYEELIALLPVRDGIPALDDPNYVSLDEAQAWIADNEPVIAIEINGDARAYPLQIMTWHEIVNDVVGDIPVTVTFCPLCNSAIVFDRRLNGETFDFGTSGWLRNSDLVMYDRQTESLWQQFTGEGIVGELAGEQLTFLSSAMISFADFQKIYPQGIVLSRETGHERPYGENPYIGYDTFGNDPFAYDGVTDDRLTAVERVVAISFEDLDIAYPFTILSEVGVINDSPGGHDLVVFHTPGTSSALDARGIDRGKDVGATGVFDPNLDADLVDQPLTFVKDGDNIVDEQTGSTWNILGQAVEGPLAGEALTPIIHANHFWFSWAAFKPDTIIYTGPN